MNTLSRILLNRLNSRAEIPRQAWTTDRWGRFLAGCGVLFFLVVAWLQNPATLSCWTIFGACVGLSQLITAFIGWCPFHELLKHFGVQDREEVFAEGLRECVRQFGRETTAVFQSISRRKAVRQAWGKNRKRCEESERQAIEAKR